MWRLRKMTAICKPRSCPVTKSCLILCDPMDCSTPAFWSSTTSWSLLKLISIESVVPSNHLILCWSPLLLSAIFPSIRVFSYVSSLNQVGGQSIGVSASASVLPMNIQGWSPLGLTDLIFLFSEGLSRVFSKTSIRKHQFFGTQRSLWSNPHIDRCLLEKA